MLSPMPGGMARWKIAARVGALALAGTLACVLNPQPEPPEADRIAGAGGSGMTTGSGTGGSQVSGEREGGLGGPGGNAGEFGDAQAPGTDAGTPTDAGTADASRDAGLEGGEAGAPDGGPNVEVGAEGGADLDGGPD